MPQIPEYRDQAAAQGLELVGSTPREFDAYIRNQMARFSKIVKVTGLRAA